MVEGGKGTEGKKNMNKNKNEICVLVYSHDQNHCSKPQQMGSVNYSEEEGWEEKKDGRTEVQDAK